MSARVRNGVEFCKWIGGPDVDDRQGEEGREARGGELGELLSVAWLFPLKIQPHQRATPLTFTGHILFELTDIKYCCKLRTVS